MRKQRVEAEKDLEADFEPGEEGGEASPSLRDELRALVPSFWFIGAWMLLSVVVNMRYPDPEPQFWYLTPAFDISVLFAIYALLGLKKWRLPRAVHVAIVVLIVLVRCIRVLDAFEFRELSRPFNLYIDVPAFPELVRLGYWTLPLWQFLIWCLAIPLVIAAVAFVTHRALRHAERYLAERSFARFYGLLFGVLAVSSLIKPRHSELYLGTFAGSAFPRLWTEVDFVLNAAGYRANTLRSIQSMERELARGPNDLARLERANVFLIFVESYGETVIDRPDFRPEILRIYADVETALEGSGFSVASGLLASPAYGGGSWLAHATMATGVRAGDQFQHDLIVAKRPKTLERFFRDAGYRTVVIEPGTTREFSGRQLNEFDEHYYSWQLGYHGPRFGWATMPDQFVLDFLRRKDFGSRGSPVFVQCVLVTSHAPWNNQPRVINDWEKIGNGAIYNELSPIKFHVNWSNMDQGGKAYIHSIGYDLEVLKRYLTGFVSDGSLFILLGDHQPIAEITHDSPDFGVPVHVISRNKAFVDAFLSRGYALGMLPQHSNGIRPMETFLLDFIRDFSTH